jgi:haloalkane dehalogenase
MPLIRTPDHHFHNLPGFPYEPNYIEINDARIHYVDEGQGEVILLLHGEPTWAYLYRKIIPPLMAGYRVIAPDFIGFGRSDKYTEVEDYTFDMHTETLKAFIEALDLSGITVVVQDWGGLIGLRTVAELPERFARLVIMNTFLPTGREPLSEAFLNWQKFAARVSSLPVARLIQNSTATEVPKDVLAAYEAPFPDPSYQAGAKIFPALVPTQRDMPGVPEMLVTRAFLKTWDRPAIVLFAEGDPVLGGAHNFFRRLIPTAREHPKINIEPASHFLQEDQGELIATHILDFMGKG